MSTLSRQVSVQPAGAYEQHDSARHCQGQQLHNLQTCVQAYMPHGMSSNTTPILVATISSI